jgi:NHLM bacteriocin system ABC transporter ATP-binding protein
MSGQPMETARVAAERERIPAGGDRPFLLVGEHVWLVPAGAVNVFTVRLRDGRPVGPRSFLLQVGAGQALIGACPGVEPEGWGLLAVGSSGTELIRLGSTRALGEGDAARGLIEGWIEGLYAAMTRDLLPALSLELPGGGPSELAPQASYRTGGELAWIKHLVGRSRFMGREGLEVNGDGFLPVSRRAWFEAAEASRLLALETGELPSHDEIASGLARLHRLVLRHAELSEREGEEAVQQRLRRKADFQDATLRQAFVQLAATMTPGPDAPAPATGPAASTTADALEDPLFAACVPLGRALGVGLKPYPRVQGAPPPRDPLAAMLRASRVRSRRVALRDEWWKGDSGPLLGYLAADKRPVSLLPAGSGGGYVLLDPATGAREPVDAARAESLEGFAESFYRPFPERRLRVRDVLRFGLHGCARDIGVVIGIGLCSSLLGMVPALATGMLFNTVIPGAQRSQLLQMTAVLLACALATALFSLAQGVALLRIEGRAGSSLQAAVWDRLLGLPLSFFRPYTSGDLATRAMSIDAMRQIVSGSTVTALIGSLLALGNFLLMYWYSWRLALWATLVIAVVLAITLTGSALQLRPQREAMKLQSKAAGIVLQLLSSIAKVRVAGVEVAAFALWVRRFSEQRRQQSRARSISNWVSAFNAAVPVVSYLVIFGLALPLVSETHALGTGDFLAFLSAFSASTTALLGASLALLATLNTIPLYEQARPILETVPEVDLGKADPGVLTGDIEVQHALFRYAAEGPPVLRDLSCHIQAGEFVAFVGPSGSGKSTLLRLLLGFETVEAGAIYYDGQELAGLDVQAVRRQIGVVLQSGRLMSGDIFTNIVGSAALSLDEAWEAARMAGLAEDLEAMPMGMHTVVSDGATTLSGGQRQRLLIARAIVNRPRILIFDEATSALDNRTQAIVSASLERLQATRIVVAHRLSTVLNADRIFVLERGRLVQTGRYAELIDQPGPFAELARRQIA